MDLLKILLDHTHHNKNYKVSDADQLASKVNTELKLYAETIEQKLLTQHDPKLIHPCLNFTCEVNTLEGREYLRLQIEFYTNKMQKKRFDISVERFILSQAKIYTPPISSIVKYPNTRNEVFNQITALIEDVMLMKV